MTGEAVEHVCCVHPEFGCMVVKRYVGPGGVDTEESRDDCAGEFATKSAEASVVVLEWDLRMRRECEVVS